jgi:hypothetical protein
LKIYSISKVANVAVVLRRLPRRVPRRVLARPWKVENAVALARVPRRVPRRVVNIKYFN